jgi:hypothetical protein
VSFVVVPEGAGSESWLVSGQTSKPTTGSTYGFPDDGILVSSPGPNEDHVEYPFYLTVTVATDLTATFSFGSTPPS